MLWAISGGAGFLGLHLARRLLADGHQVRTLDVVPLDDSELERSVEELRGDVRDQARVADLVAGADVVVHAAAALPIRASRDAIRQDFEQALHLNPNDIRLRIEYAGTLQRFGDRDAASREYRRAESDNAALIRARPDEPKQLSSDELREMQQRIRAMRQELRQ